jgi:hypothetical protein
MRTRIHHPPRSLLLGFDDPTDLGVEPSPTLEELLPVLGTTNTPHTKRIVAAIQQRVGNISTPPAAEELVEWLDGINPRQQRYGWWYSAAFVRCARFEQP